MSSSTPPTFLYKIVPISAPPPTPLPERLPLSALDETDGFIHLSTSVQVSRTLDRYFAKDTQVYLLRIVYEGVEKDIRWEDPKGTARGEMGAVDVFPHLYNGGRLGNGEIESIKTLNRDSGITWTVACRQFNDWLVC